MSTPLRQEMGYSLAEFNAVLPGAMRDWSVKGGQTTWRVADTAGVPVADIRLSPMPDRVMGMLRVPVLSVEIDFRDADDAQRSEFQRRFDRGFHRGGG